MFQQQTMAQARWIIVLAVLLALAGGVFGIPAYAAEEGVVSINPAGISVMPPSEKVGVVLGAEDIMPTFTALSRTTLRPKQSQKTATLTVYGRDLSSADTFKLGKRTLAAKRLSSTKVRLTIPLRKFSSRTYNLSLYHNGLLVSSKRVFVIKAK